MASTRCSCGKPRSASKSWSAISPRSPEVKGEDVPDRWEVLGPLAPIEPRGLNNGAPLGPVGGSLQLLDLADGGRGVRYSPGASDDLTSTTPYTHSIGTTPNERSSYRGGESGSTTTTSHSQEVAPSAVMICADCGSTFDKGRTPRLRRGAPDPTVRSSTSDNQTVKQSAAIVGRDPKILTALLEGQPSPRPRASRLTGADDTPGSRGSPAGRNRHDSADS